MQTKLIDEIEWCDVRGRPQPFVGPLVPPEMVVLAPSLANIGELRFRNPNSFVAGNLHAYPDVWDGLLERSGYTRGQVDFRQIIHEGVKVEHFFAHFKGGFKGKEYDCSTPPPIVLENSKSCSQFEQFVSKTIINWLASGVLSFHGRKGNCDPPHLVLPLTVEPSKPRLCHDERFLNLWIRDLPFKLDHLPDLPRYVFQGHFQTVFDDKSGYQHVRIHPESETYFGLCWHDCYFTFRVLPFGWKASAYLYHNLGLVISDAARSLGVPVSQYIDDRHVGQLFPRSGQAPPPNPQLAEAAAYILCYLLIEAGYFIGLEKSQSFASTDVRFLGFISDSLSQAFRIPQDKKLAFIQLREQILGGNSVDLKTLQRFAGKALSLSLAIPGCKLHVREVFKAIAQSSRRSSASIRVRGPLFDEIAFWRFLDDWKDFLPWKSERHLAVTLFTDASMGAWGGVLTRDGVRHEIRDYFVGEASHINVLEAKALWFVLSSFKGLLKDARVDVFTDNKVLLHAWNNDGCKSSEINNILKDILTCSREFNFTLQLDYRQSKENPADFPSRVCSDLDCTLTDEAWGLVERLYGPHSFDLMALDSNCRRDSGGNLLPHYTPWDTPFSSGVNVFSQPIASDGNLYVFPPFVLIGPLLRFLLDLQKPIRFTIVVPDRRPRAFWWALLSSIAIDRCCIGRRGCSRTLLFPSRQSTEFLARPLQWDLWAFRCVCSGTH